MRLIRAIILACLLSQCVAPAAEDVAAMREKGIRALKESESDPRAIVEAARCFAKASDLYATAGDDDKATEMNSFLYWCKKKMTLQDIEKFTKGADAAVAEKLDAVEKVAPKSDEAQKWLDRAEKYAKNNPEEHYLIAVRFFEVASRFVGTKESIAAQERSLKEQGLSVAKAAASKTKSASDKADVPKTGKTINLMTLIDPPKDTVEGKWNFSGGLLVCEKSERDAVARLEIPYFPPEEYDFKIVFNRSEGKSNTLQFLSRSGQDFTWVIDAWYAAMSGFELVGGKGVKDNKTAYRAPLIVNGTWHTSVVQVRKESVTAIFDGKEVSKWTPDLGKLDNASYWRLRDTKILGVGQQRAKTAFSTIELTEVTGTGKKTR